MPSIEFRIKWIVDLAENNHLDLGKSAMYLTKKQCRFSIQVRYYYEVITHELNSRNRYDICVTSSSPIRRHSSITLSSFWPFLTPSPPKVINISIDRYQRRYLG